MSKLILLHLLKRFQVLLPISHQRVHRLAAGVFVHHRLLPYIHGAVTAKSLRWLNRLLSYDWVVCSLFLSSYLWLVDRFRRGGRSVVFLLCGAVLFFCSIRTLKKRSVKWTTRNLFNINHTSLTKPSRPHEVWRMMTFCHPETCRF